MLISVILPIRNEGPFIEEALRAVLAQDYLPEQIEVIVVDGMSDDGTRDIVQRLASQEPRLRMLDNPDHITPAALNRGLRAARGEVIVRVDGHGVVPPDYVRECVTLLRKEQKAEEAGRNAEAERQVGGGAGGRTSNIEHPRSNVEEVGGAETGGRQPVVSDRWSAAGALLAVGGAWDCTGRGRMGKAIALATSSRLGVGGSRYRTCGPERQPVPTDSVPFWAMRREVFERIGLFHENMLCHEDYELNCRLRRAGGTILLLPWLRSKYYVRSTLGALACQYARYGFWKGRFLCSYPGSLGARHLAPPVLVALLAACAGGALVGDLGRLCLVSLLGLYGGFLLAATAWLVASPKSGAQSPGPESKVRGPKAEFGNANPELHSPKAAVRGAKPAGGRWRQAPLLPVVLATLHLCWGAGVWAGLVRGKVRGQPPRLEQ